MSNTIANRRQSALALATIVLGSLTISTVFTVNQNIDFYIDHLIDKNGGANIFIRLVGGGGFFDSKDIVDLHDLPTTSYVAGQDSIPITVRNKEKMVNASLILASESYFKARPIKIETGQTLGSLGDLHPRNNVVVSTSTLEALGLHPGHKLKLKLNSADRSLISNVIGSATSVFSQDDRPKVWASQPTFQYLSNLSKLSSLIIGTRDLNQLDTFEETIRALLSPKYGSSLDLYNPKKYFDNLKAEYETFIYAGAVIGMLALFGGTLGVLNIMLMGIRVRMKEIGLYRALGFPTAVVLLVFMTESLLTLSLGGVIGSLLGCFCGFIISSQIVTTEPFLTPLAFVYGFLATFSIGLLFSYLPARRAASIDTVKALKS